MKRQSIYRVELKRAFSSKLFFVSVTIGCMLAALQAWDVYQVFLDIASMRKAKGIVLYEGDSIFGMFMGHDIFYWESRLFFFIMPLLCTLPHAISYADDKKTGYIRSIVTRIDRDAYYRAKYLAVFLSGGAIAAIPQLANLLFLSLFGPIKNLDISSAVGTPDRFWMYSLYVRNIGLYTILFIAIDYIIYGIFATLGLFASQFTSIRFTVLVSPFITFVLMHNICDFFRCTQASPYSFSYAAQPVTFQPGVVFSELGILFLITFVGFCIYESKRDII